MTACPDRLLLLHALVDGELDAVNSVAVEAHLKSCVGCAEELGRIEAMHAALADTGVRHQAPPALRDRIDQALAEAAGAVREPVRNQASAGRNLRWPWLAGGAFTAMAASMLLLLAAPQFTTVAMQDQLVSSHVRSLLASHLTDVATSNRHVVKPWFNGRIDFAPPVVELARQGFPLVGGRLDYLNGRVVPAIVYRRNLHVINLFVLPKDRFASPAGFIARKHGYSLVRWTDGGLDFWAVSDVEPGDLEAFHRAFVQAAKG
jgi:anti-sigma factor RsiW